MKKLISADTIRKAHAAGNLCVEARMTDCIVTPEARSVAAQLGMTLTLLGPGDVSRESCAPAVTSAVTSGATPDAAAMKAICDGVLAQFPGLSPALVEQLAGKALQEAAAPAPLYQSCTSKGGIKVVKGDSLCFERFDGAGPGTNVRIVDVVTAADKSSMAAGFMHWDNLFFPWTLTYDEVDIVLEGELHIRHQGETMIGRVGDVLFIPKNSSIEFGTPSHVRFMYVAFPANWQDA